MHRATYWQIHVETQHNVSLPLEPTIKVQAPERKLVLLLLFKLQYTNKDTGDSCGRGLMMRLFHVSEQSNIALFAPRLPTRKDLDRTIGLVWAIDEMLLPNFLTPRNCPRVAYYVGKNTSELDKLKFFSSSTQTHAVAIEGNWYEALKSTTLYLYEFEPDDFELQDEVAGYYVAKTAQKPKETHQINDLLGELVRRNTEIRIVDT